MKTQHGNVALFVPHAGCTHQCSFCNQRHIAGQTQPLTPQKVTAVCERAAATMTLPSAQAEIAFFGGSFTAIPHKEMVSLLQAAYPFVENGQFAGIRLSTRPDAVDSETLKLLKQYGVTTVELGAQSMDDAVLLKNSRGHTAHDVEQASYCIKQVGLALGLQMMTGLPQDTNEGTLETASRLAALQPDCVRIYPTLVIDHTPLAHWYRQGKYQPQTLEQAIELCAQLLTFFEERNIPVIRLGLHDEPNMAQHCLAGPFHPAFRERCESRRFLSAIQDELKMQTACKVTVRVAPSRLSQVIGQQKENIRALKALGYTVRVVADAALHGKDIRVEVIE